MKRRFRSQTIHSLFGSVAEEWYKDRVMASSNSSRWRCIAICLASLCLLLVVVVVALTVVYIKHTCLYCASDSDSILDISEPTEPGVFHDLTSKELTSIRDYMNSLDRFKLVSPPNWDVKSSRIYAVHLYLPTKNDVLKHLDDGAHQPARQAKIILFRGDLDTPVIEEYIVGPLPRPDSCELLASPARKNSIPFSWRPFNVPEILAVFDPLVLELDSRIKNILIDSYGATFTNCGGRCLKMFPVAVSSALIGPNSRRMWFRAHRNIEGYTLYPTDLQVLLSLDVVDPYVIEKVVYADKEYSSLADLAARYNASNIPKTNSPFPTVDNNLISTLHLRGKPVPEDSKAPPRLFEPNGRRYSVKHNHVSYLQWTFDVGMSPLFGPRVYDIRFNDERIVYEVSLQEISVFYSGHSPSMKISDFIDSVGYIGLRSAYLTPGVDCPETAVYLNKHLLVEISADPFKQERAVCIFEQNTGVPLRRHQFPKERIYSGMVDNVLVVRSIHTIENYDYIVDFIFHQNGAVEIRVISTGYISSTFKVPGEERYGFHLFNDMIGSIHQHLFHFKADLDIQGTSNRYETLDIVPEQVDIEKTTGSREKTYWQTKLERTLKLSEMDAAYRFNFDRPKYHIVYNDKVKSSMGNRKAYRIHHTGMHKQPLPENGGNEQTISWARYQMAMTKVKDDERESSSVYSMLDVLDPVVNFTNFLADDESIVDEDIVAWLTVGLHHIPHTEDLPVTTTVGGHIGFFLLPYNYFDECPAMASRDAIRIEPKDADDIEAGFSVEGYGKTESPCVPPKIVTNGR